MTQTIKEGIGEVAGRMRLMGDRARRIPSLPGWSHHMLNPMRGHLAAPARRTELNRLTNGQGLSIS